MLKNFRDPDSGSYFVIREFHVRQPKPSETQRANKITLQPLSDDSAYQSIELEGDESSKVEVVGVFECVISGG